MVVLAHVICPVFWELMHKYLRRQKGEWYVQTFSYLYKQLASKQFFHFFTYSLKYALRCALQAICLRLALQGDHERLAGPKKIFCSKVIVNFLTFWLDQLIFTSNS